MKVLKTYDTNTIDLLNEHNYRDLSKPIGALDPKRLQYFKEKYDSLTEDENIKKFHYGTHYSGAGPVLHFLIRME